MPEQPAEAKHRCPCCVTRRGSWGPRRFNTALQVHGLSSADRAERKPQEPADLEGRVGAKGPKRRARNRRAASRAASLASRSRSRSRSASASMSSDDEDENADSPRRERSRSRSRERDRDRNAEKKKKADKAAPRAFVEPPRTKEFEETGYLGAVRAAAAAALLSAL
jgi:hypothetical protein